MLLVLPLPLPLLLLLQLVLTFIMQSALHIGMKLMNGTAADRRAAGIGKSFERTEIARGECVDYVLSRGLEKLGFSYVMDDGKTVEAADSASLHLPVVATFRHPKKAR